MVDKTASTVDVDVDTPDAELLILVDHQDTTVGFMSKDRCHDGHGVLHRAFSVFIFNEHDELLLQQRSVNKRLWPLFWSNSCCSHPYKGESMDDAVRRRLSQELGIASNLTYLYKFIYEARFRDRGAENELCWVYAGRSSDPIQADQNEIANWRFMAPNQLDQELAHKPGRFTPWLGLEWRRIQRDFGDTILAL